MERPIKQNFAPVWRLIRLCSIPVGICGVFVGVILYNHGQKGLTPFIFNVLGSVLAFTPVLLAIAIGGMQPTIKWFITDSGMKRVIRSDVLIIPWQQIYHMANTDLGFFVRWREPMRPGVAPEDLEHRARFYPVKADADELIVLWQKNVSGEEKIGSQAHFKARNRRTSGQMLLLSRGMLALAVALIGWGGWNIARQYPSTSWPSVEGKIVSQYYRVIPAGGSHKNYPKGEVTLSYEYAVGGRTYQSDQYSLPYTRFNGDVNIADAFAKQNQRDAVVKVYYNPKHPEQAVLLTGPSWSDNFALMFGGGFLGFIGVLVRMLDNIAKRAHKMQTH